MTKVAKVLEQLSQKILEIADFYANLDLRYCDLIGENILNNFVNFENYFWNYLELFLEL